MEMDPKFELTVHLVLAALAAYVVTRLLRALIIAFAKMCGITEKEPWKRIGEALDSLLPVFPSIPSGFFFVLWPASMILDSQIAQFLAGMVAGSFAANIYEAAQRFIDKRLKRKNGNSTPPKP